MTTKFSAVEPGMQRIFWWIAADKDESQYNSHFDIEADATGEEIQNRVKELVLEQIKFSWAPANALD